MSLLFPFARQIPAFLFALGWSAAPLCAQFEETETIQHWIDVTEWDPKGEVILTRFPQQPAGPPVEVVGCTRNGNALFIQFGCGPDGAGGCYYADGTFLAFSEEPNGSLLKDWDLTSRWHEIVWPDFPSLDEVVSLRMTDIDPEFREAIGYIELEGGIRFPVLWELVSSGWDEGFDGLVGSYAVGELFDFETGIREFPSQYTPTIIGRRGGVVWGQSRMKDSSDSEFWTGGKNFYEWEDEYQISWPDGTISAMPRDITEFTPWPGYTVVPNHYYMVGSVISEDVDERVLEHGFFATLADTKQTGGENLLTILAGAFENDETRANCVSGDGAIVGGALRAAGGEWVPAVWVGKGIVVPEVPSGFTSGELLSANWDGSRLTGYVESGHGESSRQAVLWEEESGLVLLEEFLEAEFGYTIDGNSLEAEVSVDGTVCYGRIQNPDGTVDGYSLRLPVRDGRLGSFEVYEAKNRDHALVLDTSFDGDFLLRLEYTPAAYDPAGDLYYIVDRANGEETALPSEMSDIVFQAIGISGKADLARWEALSGDGRFVIGYFEFVADEDIENQRDFGVRFDWRAGEAELVEDFQPYAATITGSLMVGRVWNDRSDLGIWSSEDGLLVVPAFELLETRYGERLYPRESYWGPRFNRVSGNGETVSGSISIQLRYDDGRGDGVTVPVMWTPEEGLHLLDTNMDEFNLNEGQVNVVSENGEYLAGNMRWRDPADGRQALWKYPVVWAREGGREILEFPEGYRDGDVQWVSNDGQVAYGTCGDAHSGNQVPFLWRKGKPFLAGIDTVSNYLGIDLNPITDLGRLSQNGHFALTNLLGRFGYVGTLAEVGSQINPRVVPMDASTLELEFRTRLDRTYTIEGTTDFFTWDLFKSDIPGTGGLPMSETVPIGAGTAFWRVTEAE